MLRNKQIAGIFLYLYMHRIETARILAIFPTPSISHQVIFRPITQELVNRGHEVTVITPDPAFANGHAPTNLTEVDVHNISYDYWYDFKLIQTENNSPLLKNKIFLIRLSTVLDLQLQTPGAQTILKRPKHYFDLILLEACNAGAIGIHNIFDAPITLISSFGLVSGQYGNLGAPMHPFLYPTPERQRIYNLTRWEKIVEILKYALFEYFLICFKKQNDLILSKHFGAVQNYHDLYKNVKMVFVNEHPIWADNRPLPPNIHYIGGIHQSPENELPKDLKKILDDSENGVIYMSLGTNVITSVLPNNTLGIIMRVFSELPYDVLMKWDDDKLPELPPNIKIQKWFPQSDVLKHPKIKLFITQGGLQSTDEAINAAVPLLAFPVLGDQWYNAEKYVKHKIGLQLDLYTLKEEEFKKNIETIINDKSYKNNIMRLRTLMREYPIKPLDLAVWWTEHIIKYGGDHLVPPSAYLTWTEYYEVELIVIILSVSLFIILLSIYLIKLLFDIIIKKCFTYFKVKTK